MQIAHQPTSNTRTEKKTHPQGQRTTNKTAEGREHVRRSEQPEGSHSGLNWEWAGQEKAEGAGHGAVVCLHSSVSCIGILSLSDCSAEPSGFSMLSGKQATPAPGSDTTEELLFPVSPWISPFSRGSTLMWPAWETKYVRQDTHSYVHTLIHTHSCVHSHTHTLSQSHTSALTRSHSHTCSHREREKKKV